MIFLLTQRHRNIEENNKISSKISILQNSLTSISNICFVAHVIFSEASFEENLNTLRFADRTKNTDLKGRLSMLDESGFGFGGVWAVGGLGVFGVVWVVGCVGVGGLWFAKVTFLEFPVRVGEVQCAFDGFFC